MQGQGSGYCKQDCQNEIKTPDSTLALEE